MSEKSMKTPKKPPPKAKRKGSQTTKKAVREHNKMLTPESLRKTPAKAKKKLKRKPTKVNREKLGIVVRDSIGMAWVYILKGIRFAFSTAFKVLGHAIVNQIDCAMGPGILSLGLAGERGMREFLVLLTQI